MATTRKAPLIIAALLIFIIAVSAYMRLSPVLSYDKPLKFDSYWHARVAGLYDPLPPTSIPWPEGGRPNFYPPAYHYLLLSVAPLFGSLLEASRFLLPIAAVITVLATFLLVRRFRGDNAALMAALFAAIAPHALAGSYDSPQGIGLLISIPAFYLLYKGKSLAAGLLLALIFLTDTFPAAYFAIVAVASVIFFQHAAWKPRRTTLAKLLLPSATAMAAWFAAHVSSFACMTNSVGTYFLGLVGPLWMDQESPIIFTVLFVGLFFAYKQRSRLDVFDKFWITWTLLGAALYFSYPLTPVFHPWRQNAMLFFGFYMVLPAILLRLRTLRPLFLLTFIGLAATSSLVVTLSGSLSPPLDPNDYAAMSWLASHPAPTTLLAHPDFCAGYQTLHKQSCLMDIYLECIPDKKKWFDLENVYYTNSREEVRRTLEEYGVRRFVYQDKLPQYIESLGYDKVYTAWSTPRYTPDSVYQR